MLDSVEAYPEMPPGDVLLSDPAVITQEEWETVKRQVAEMHEFMCRFATQMESLGGAMGNPAALMQMIMGGRKPKRTGT